MKSRLAALIFLISIFNVTAAEKIYISDKHSYLIEKITDGLEYPWSFEFTYDDKILITERPGRLRIFENGQLSSPIKGLPDIKAEGQGGLLDIVLDANFSSNKILFFGFSPPKVLRKNTRHSESPLVTNCRVLTFS